MRADPVCCRVPATLTTKLRQLLEGQGFTGTVVTEVYRTSFSQLKELENSLYSQKKPFKPLFPDKFLAFLCLFAL